MFKEGEITSLFNGNRDLSQTSQRYSIKKFKFGAASVLVGLSFLGYGSQTVLAETPVEDTTTVTTDATPATATESTNTDVATVTETTPATTDATPATATEPTSTDVAPVSETEAGATGPAAEPILAEGATLRAVDNAANIDPVSADRQTSNQKPFQLQRS
ncbi:YSIRK-type signal peptide-containing protein [Streptococcus pluranimalium]|uniref:YSIRK-type signal peptide-containing protein n=1 Tax=Streptococcus pluranimalium TaxID=82348 RepID=UPI003BF78B80